MISMTPIMTMQIQTMINDHGFSMPGTPPTFIPSKPVKNPSGKKIAATIVKT